MEINRRNFLKLSAATAGVAVVGGMGYMLSRDPDPLADFYTGTETALGARFGQNRAKAVVQDIRQAYAELLLAVPYIGGEDNIFTECGICKFYRAQGAGGLAPYLCLSDYVVSHTFDRGLVRYKTIAEGAAVCDFRYRQK